MLVSPASVGAQDPSQHLGGWYAAEASWRPAGSRLGVEADFQLRDFQMVGDFAQTSLRAGVVVHARSRPLSLTVGGAGFLQGTPGEATATRSERRLYQTVSYTQRLSSTLRLKHRGRAEQRWFENDVFRSRYRYRLEAERAVSGRGFGPGGVWLVASHELLLNGEVESDVGAFDRLDQNRSYLAVNYPRGSTARMEAGYLNVVRPGEMRHRIRLTVEWAVR